MPDISFFYTEIQAWMLRWDKFLNVVMVIAWMSGVYHLLHMPHSHTHTHTHTHTEVRIKLLAPQSVLPCFLETTL